MNRLEGWRREGLIEILLSEPAQHEATVDGNVARVRKAYSYIASLDTFRSPEETTQENKVEEILFPGGVRTASERSDVRIVAHALKYCCILITADGGSRRQPGGILGHRSELANQLGVKVMTDEEAVLLVAQKIRDRDEAARRLASVTGEILPDWIGCD